MLGGVLSNLLHLLSIDRIGISKSLEVISLIDCVGNTACNLDALIKEEFLSLFKSLIRDNEQISMCFKIDFIDLQLLRNDRPCRIKSMKVLHFLDFVGTSIDRNFETFVVAGTKGTH